MKNLVGAFVSLAAVFVVGCGDTSAQQSHVAQVDGYSSSSPFSFSCSTPWPSVQNDAYGYGLKNWCSQSGFDWGYIICETAYCHHFDNNPSLSTDANGYYVAQGTQNGVPVVVQLHDPLYGRVTAVPVVREEKKEEKKETPKVVKKAPKKEPRQENANDILAALRLLLNRDSSYCTHKNHLNYEEQEGVLIDTGDGNCYVILDERDGRHHKLTDVSLCNKEHHHNKKKSKKKPAKKEDDQDGDDDA